MDFTFQKCKFLTVPMQKLLIVMYEKRRQPQFSFFDQQIYKNERSFLIAVGQLKNANIVKERGTIDNNLKIKRLYEITIEGIVLVEEVLRDFIEHNRPDQKGR